MDHKPHFNKFGIKMLNFKILSKKFLVVDKILKYSLYFKIYNSYKINVETR
jgi:hypothetical protein